MALKRRVLPALPAFFFTNNHDKDRFGFSFVSGVPETPEATQALSERIGFIRETQCMRQSFRRG